MRGMVETLLKQMHHVRVIQKIAGIFTDFTKIHQVRLAKDAQLVTDRGRFHINGFRQAAASCDNPSVLVFTFTLSLLLLLSG